MFLKAAENSRNGEVMVEVGWKVMTGRRVQRVRWRATSNLINRNRLGVLLSGATRSVLSMSTCKRLLLTVLHVPLPGKMVMVGCMMYHP